jgi:hypothetical protein
MAFEVEATTLGEAEDARTQLLVIYSLLFDTGILQQLSIKVEGSHPSGAVIDLNRIASQNDDISFTIKTDLIRVFDLVLVLLSVPAQNPRNKGAFAFLVVTPYVDSNLASVS